jgi:CPA1 family monovalent cation:H+ antiporter
MRSVHTFTPHVVKILTWGGLRGGISVALALSIPETESRDLIIVMTYIVVVFSILVQGLTVKPLIQYALKENV